MKALCAAAAALVLSLSVAAPAIAKDKKPFVIVNEAVGTTSPTGPMR